MLLEVSSPTVATGVKLLLSAYVETQFTPQETRSSPVVHVVHPGVTESFVFCPERLIGVAALHLSWTNPTPHYETALQPL